jgi:hypothetical protein
MLNWILELLTRTTSTSPAPGESWIAGASNPADVESRLQRWEQRASEYGLRLP